MESREWENLADHLPELTMQQFNFEVDDKISSGVISTSTEQRQEQASLMQYQHLSPFPLLTPSSHSYGSLMDAGESTLREIASDNDDSQSIIDICDSDVENGSEADSASSAIDIGSGSPLLGADFPNCVSKSFDIDDSAIKNYEHSDDINLLDEEYDLTKDSHCTIAHHPISAHFQSSTDDRKNVQLKNSCDSDYLIGIASNSADFKPTVSHNLKSQIQTNQSSSDFYAGLSSDPFIVVGDTLSLPNGITISEIMEMPEWFHSLPLPPNLAMQFPLDAIHPRTKYSKNPGRYLRIRNHIYAEWIKLHRLDPSKRLSQRHIRQGLQKEGDVNAIGKIFEFLERHGHINVGLWRDVPGSSNPRRKRGISMALSELDDFESEKFQQVAVDSSLLIPSAGNEAPMRAKRVRSILIQQNLPYSPPYSTSKTPTSSKRFRKVGGVKVDKLNPFELVPLLSLPSTVHINVEINRFVLIQLILLSHISRYEIIGLIGGYQTDDKITLTTYYTATLPPPPQHQHQLILAENLQNIGGDFGTVDDSENNDLMNLHIECELDPQDDIDAREWFWCRGQKVLAWSHSHPSFEPTPSRRDLETQRLWQRSLPHFLGLIISPHYLRAQCPWSMFTMATEDCNFRMDDLDYPAMVHVSLQEPSQLSHISTAANTPSSKHQDRTMFSFEEVLTWFHRVLNSATHVVPWADACGDHDWTYFDALLSSLQQILSFDEYALAQKTLTSLLLSAGTS